MAFLRVFGKGAGEVPDFVVFFGWRILARKFLNVFFGSKWRSVLNKIHACNFKNEKGNNMVTNTKWGNNESYIFTNGE